MRRFTIICAFFAAAISTVKAGEARELLVEAESFTDKGGWVVDQQFMDRMGSPYLMAHGMGRPVDDASTDIVLPSTGKWYVYVRTYNWTSPWSGSEGPGRFRVLIDGDALCNTVGAAGNCWQWQYAGSFKAKSKSVSVHLKDLTGFDGRCDAVYMSKARKAPREDMHALRLRLNPGYGTPSETQEYDFVVVGGGIAGICAAVSAAREGLKVALVQDRRVLGGNNSSEVRVHLGGRVNVGPYPNLGNLLREFGHEKKGNAGVAANYQDWKKDSIIRAEPGITLLTPLHVAAVEKEGAAVTAVLARNIETGVLTRIKAPLFADCTGDGNVGFLAGADWTMGRESREVYGESLAPEASDSLVMGASVQWYSVWDKSPSSFPVFEYGIEFSDESVQRIKKGEWTWETGLTKDQIEDAEQIRDYGMAVVYSNWSYLKNRMTDNEAFKKRSLGWVAYIAGKRESRRLLGDHILNENDILNEIPYPDGTAATSWSIDLHYPDPSNSRFFPGMEFKSVCTQTPCPFYPVPYRCLYSRNVSNLFMAGRDISVSHVALGTVRVMRTCAMLGEVVGLAASVCHRYGCLPGDVYPEHFESLKALMTRGAGKQDAPDNQNFNLGQRL